MKKVAELIKNAKSAVLLPHISADADALASCQAMRCALESFGIDAVIIAEEKVEPRLSFIGDDVCVFDGDILEFDTCIVLDCGDLERIGKRAEIVNSAKTVINIDHHRTNKGFGDVSLVCADASATGEILYTLFKEMDVEITQKIAKYLYTAICSDTGCFAYSNVSPQTFITASELIRYDINHAEIARLLFDCVDIDEELLKAELTKNIKSYCDGKVTTVTMTEEFAKRFNLNSDEVDGLVDIPRRIRGTEIAVSLKEVNGKIRVSLRSNGDADVSKVALKFDGGGHIKAAGCSIYKSIEEAEAMVVAACEEVL
ncbi:MAG: bifunctional oligoribonuclease/PAP phosphatase NrnA [Clostridia bacterium]|nr:bifunctional oligoribonuclease/PAP phosphatase NrnA [Clostridia bacterium]